MSRLGYTDFINKHKNIFFALFIFGLVVLWIIPTIYIDISKYHNLTIRDNTLFSFSPIYLCIRGFKTSRFISAEYESHSFLNLTYNEYYSSVIKYYIDGILAIIFAILIIIVLICLIIRFAKAKSISRLIVLPYCFTIALNIAILIVYSLSKQIQISYTPLNLIFTLLFSIPVFLYCLNFQRFSKSREHKPTDKERIAELERQVAELQKEKDAD